MTTGVRNVRAVLVVQGAFAISAVIVSVGVAAYPPSTMLLLWAVAVVGSGPARPTRTLPTRIYYPADRDATAEPAEGAPPA